MIRKKHTILMALLASMTGLLQANQGSSDWNNQDSLCCPETECCDDSMGRFFIGADLLYWKTHISGLELDFGNSSITTSSSDGAQSITTDEYDADPHFKWKAGYRIAAGYQLPCSEWGIGAIWTHFQDSSSRHDDGESDTANTGSVKVKFNQLDVVAAYNTSLSDSCLIKPFIGLRGTKINENVNALLITDITVISPSALATQTRTFDDSQSYRGIGPVLGLQADWDVGCGFGLYGTAAASLLYGKYKLHFDDTDVVTAPFSTQVLSTNTRHLRGFDWNIDLAIGVRWETCLCDSYQVSMKLGYEHHQYFNQSRLGANRGDLSFDGGVFSIGLAL